MGSPITFSGFNQIDFNIVLNAVMQQESRPLQALQAQQTALHATDGAYVQLATRLDALQDAARALGSRSTATAYAATATDSAAVSATASSAGVAGRYDVVVQELARAQVTASSSTAPDADATVIADGGTLTIGGVAVTLTGPTTLTGLAAAINAAEAPAAATVLQTAPGTFRLVLTGRATGAANAFTVENALTNATLTFADSDNDGIAANSAADNAVTAADAAVLINNIAVTSASNVVSDAIPGVALTLLKQDASKTVTVTIARDDDALATKVETFITAYNAIVTFANEQATAAGKGTTGTLGRDALLRSLRAALRSTLSGAHGTGAFTRLAEAGIGFTRTGELRLDRAVFDAALASDASGIQALFAAPGAGVFASVETLLRDYTRAGGLVPDARARVSDELSRLGRRIDDMQARLAVRRAALQREYTAADAAMTRLSSQSGALASFGRSLSTSGL